MSYYKNNNPERYRKIHLAKDFISDMSDHERIVRVGDNYCRIASSMEVDTLNLAELLECEPENWFEKEARDRLEKVIVSIVIKKLNDSIKEEEEEDVEEGE